jgi:hypothetical protein
MFLVTIGKLPRIIAERINSSGIKMLQPALCSATMHGSTSRVKKKITKNHEVLLRDGQQH